MVYLRIEIKTLMAFRHLWFTSYLFLPPDEVWIVNDLFENGNKFFFLCLGKNIDINGEAPEWGIEV